MNAWKLGLAVGDWPPLGAGLAVGARLGLAVGDRLRLAVGLAVGLWRLSRACWLACSRGLSSMIIHYLTKDIDYFVNLQTFSYNPNRFYYNGCMGFALFISHAQQLNKLLLLSLTSLSLRWLRSQRWCERRILTRTWRSPRIDPQTILRKRGLVRFDVTPCIERRRLALECGPTNAHFIVSSVDCTSWPRRNINYSGRGRGSRCNNLDILAIASEGWTRCGGGSTGAVVVVGTDCSSLDGWTVKIMDKE